MDELINVFYNVLVLRNKPRRTIMTIHKGKLKEIRSIHNRACRNICRISKKVCEGHLMMSDSIKLYIKTWEGIRNKAEEEILSL